MARRRAAATVRYVALQPLSDTPGPEADADTLRRHYIRWLDTTSCLSYDNRIWTCAWCARQDVDLTVRERGSRDEPRFCSERCRDAKAAYERECWPKPVVSEEDIERRLAKEEKRKRQDKSADSYGHGPVRV